MTCLWFLGNTSFLLQTKKDAIINPKIQGLLMRGVDYLFIHSDKLKTKQCFLLGAFVYILGFVY